MGQAALGRKEGKLFKRAFKALTFTDGIILTKEMEYQ